MQDEDPQAEREDQLEHEDRLHHRQWAKVQGKRLEPERAGKEKGPEEPGRRRTRLTTVRQRGRAVVDCASTTASRCSTAPHALDRADRVAKKIAAAIGETLSSSLARTGRRWTTAPA